MGQRAVRFPGTHRRAELILYGPVCNKRDPPGFGAACDVTGRRPFLHGPHTLGQCLKPRGIRIITPEA